MRKIIFFVLAVSISLVGATYRWGDSAHSIGLINDNGGKVRHSSSLEAGFGKYVLIATATVIPPYRGDAKVVLEGTPELDHEIHLSAPVIDLGIHKLPKFKDNVLYNLQPKDRIALWLVMKAPAAGGSIKGRYTLALYDTKTEKSILRVPLVFKAKEEADNAKECQH